MRAGFFLIGLFVAAPSGACGAAPAASLPSGLLPGTVYGAVRMSGSGAQVPFCVLNPASVGTATVSTAGPAASVFRQDAFGTLVSIPRLESGIVQTSNAQVVPQFYASGAAQLRFTDATDGTIVFAAGSTALGGGTPPAFSGYNVSFNPTTGLLSVYFNINLSGCVLPFEAAYQS